MRSWKATVPQKGGESKTYYFGVSEKIRSEAGAKKVFKQVMGYDRMPGGTQVEMTNATHLGFNW